MIQLYYYPGNANLAPHMILEEMGIPYELVLLDTEKKEHQQAAYMKLNPTGKIPTLLDDGLVLTETAAICLHLADKYSGGKLVPALGTPQRAQLYRWLMYLTNTLQAELITYFYPHRLAQEEAAIAQVKANAEARVAEMIDLLENSLAQSGGAYLLGEQFTLLDPYLFMLCRWTRNMHKPARKREHLGRFLNLLAERPCVQRTFEMEGIAAPYF
ncbi:glutathione S-transferase family protein [Undibacterium sp. Jales W-56]|uniref:glutathione S-transferase family protein n=1 Tax=Undibacterium sp. Jales W-56 TaxID=2897325 RepID=UPI0021D14358|nr:glutathione S-transferase family protein [Undibacterium sp. Jales W-56]MCU6432573.1 glutathione S-transferase family protein [Undibacterium sp. Jales W-56]